MGLFFPLTFLLAALALRHRGPRLAVADALVMLLALGTCRQVISERRGRHAGQPRSGHAGQPIRSASETTMPSGPRT